MSVHKYQLDAIKLTSKNDELRKREKTVIGENKKLERQVKDLSSLEMRLEFIIDHNTNESMLAKIES